MNVPGCDCKWLLPFSRVLYVGFHCNDVIEYFSDVDNLRYCKYHFTYQWWIQDYGNGGRSR